MAGSGRSTLLTATALVRGRLEVPRVEMEVTVVGVPRGRFSLELGVTTVGSGPACDIVVDDPQVSKAHCTLELTEEGLLVRDHSKNGTFVAGLRVVAAYLPPDGAADIGRSRLSVRVVGAPRPIALSPSASFGEVLGGAPVMRALFARLDHAAKTEETIVLLGESGTGKELLAHAIHQASGRREGPLVVFDCGAVAPNLLEAELFGYAKGAFTGANVARTGLLQQADGGTLLLDEIGELALDLQPKLLRAIEARQYRPLGSNTWHAFDTRIVAATHRDLRQLVAARTFREDLYYRLAVVEAKVPPLRERREDIELLTERFLAARTPPRSTGDLPPGALTMLTSHDWPGNVRELRNTVTRLLLFPELGNEAFDVPTQGGAGGNTALGSLGDLPLRAAREQVVEDFELRYLSAKLRDHDGNVSRSAAAMGVSRQLVHRMMERYGLRSKG